MPKGDIVGMFTGRVYLSLMAKTTTTMEKESNDDSTGNG
jgi:hypothetical protein